MRCKTLNNLKAPLATDNITYVDIVHLEPMHHAKNDHMLGAGYTCDHWVAFSVLATSASDIKYTSLTIWN
jgi:hypothetical protein